MRTPKQGYQARGDDLDLSNPPADFTAIQSAHARMAEVERLEVVVAERNKEIEKLRGVVEGVVEAVCGGPVSAKALDKVRAKLFGYYGNEYAKGTMYYIIDALDPLVEDDK